MKKLQKVMDAINRYYISELLYFDETVPIVFIQQKVKRWIEELRFYLFMARFSVLFKEGLLHSLLVHPVFVVCIHLL
jgi:hypothetical protein